jgi:hypothetical protein
MARPQRSRNYGLAAAVLLSLCIFVLSLYVFHGSLPAAGTNSGYGGSLESRAEQLIRTIQKDTVTLERLVANLHSSTATVADPKAVLLPANNEVPATHQSAREGRRDRPSSSSSFRRAGHPILALSDELLRSTPLSEMMSWYNESLGGGSCAGDFGNELVHRWRATKKSNCDQPNGDQSNGGKASSMNCYLVKQTKHHGHGDNLCVLENVAVNLGVYADSGVTTPVIERYVDTKHSDQPYVHFSKGFIHATCNPTSEWKSISMPGWNEDWSFNGMDFVETIKCDEWVENNVLIVQRDTFAVSVSRQRTDNRSSE